MPDRSVISDCVTNCREFSDWPNIYRVAGEVRRCPHGRIWEWVGSSGFTYSSAHWRRLSPFWERRRVRKAEAAIAELEALDS
jgi:hypothetical protein